MVDYTEVALLASSTFFAVLSFSLLYRYRQVSQQMKESTDMGRDLWQALEQRMRKQDERILDVMARFDVVQSRVMLAQAQPHHSPSAASASEPVPGVSSPQPAPEIRDLDVTPVQASLPQSQPPSQVESQAPPGTLQLDETQLKAIQLLSSGDLNTRKITDALGKSREHTARVMKSLFEHGLVTRDDSKKPFVYRLTDLGKKQLSQA